MIMTRSARHLGLVVMSLAALLALGGVAFADAMPPPVYRAAPDLPPYRVPAAVESPCGGDWGMLAGIESWISDRPNIDGTIGSTCPAATAE